MRIEDIKKNIDNNPDIPFKMKELVKETFSDIYEFLGERGFKRWLFDNKFNSLSRKIIIRVVMEDDFLKNHPSVSGYCANPDKKHKTKIVLRKHVGDNKDVTSHEIFHSLVNGYGEFGAFLGEGITEYLSQKLYGRDTGSYKEAVQVVSLLHAMYGDKIFKYYLAQKGQFFFHRFIKRSKS